jgi:Soluble lytic murein transglycosylase and related regulatory proteins (some contain LysM/invasin domains)
MSGIKIPVEAQFNAADLKQATDQFVQQFNKLGQMIAQANKVKFTPIDKASVDDLKKVTQQFESLLKVSTALRQRLSATGQSGAGFFDVDWARVYSDPSIRARRMREAFEYVTGYSFPATAGSSASPARPAAPPPPPAPPPTPAAAGVAGAGRQILGAGLSALGPAGGVANNALTAGLAGGAMAGLVGLAGGLLALGIGKAIGAVREKIGAAEQEFISYDVLKRSLGDVNVGFETLKESLRASSSALDITFQEGQKLGEQFARMANLAPEAYRTLASEVAIGGGFGRAFGMDPGRSSAFFAQMRLFGVTRNENDSRRLALMIGEGIARGGAFAKAEEVLAAIGNFAAQQTRLGLVTANVGGYAGMLAAMTGSGIPGLDVEGAGALLGRVNSAIAGGSAAGEAGQHFIYAALGSRLGLNPIQTAILREQGAFGTGSAAFGSGSLYARFAEEFGLSTPGAAAGSASTNLQMIMEHFRKIYAGRPELMANAMSNFFGINTSQAMALALTKPEALTGIMDRLGRSGTGLDLSRLSYTGIEALARIQTGGRDVLEAQARSLFARTGVDALSPAERDRLTAALQGGNEETLRDVLTELTATREQERTEGSETRRTIVGVQNEVQRLASLTVPLLNDMRAGIIYMAGGGKRGPMGIQLAVAEAEAEERKEAIRARYDSYKLSYDEANSAYLTAYEEFRRNGSTMTPEEQAAARARLRELADARRRVGETNRSLEEEKAAALSAEDEALRRQQDQIRQQFTGTPGTEFARVFDALIMQESGGRHTDETGNLVTNPRSGAAGISQLMPGTARDPGFGVVGIRNNSREEYLRVGREYLNAMLRRYGGDWRKALAAYNWGPGNVDRAVQQYGDDWLAHAPQETQAYVPAILSRAGMHDAPVPGGVRQVDVPGQTQHVAIHGQFTLNSPTGTPLAPPVNVSTRVGVPVPYGAR